MADDIAGLLGYHGLTDWWLSTFTHSEREYIERVYQPFGEESGARRLTQGNIQDTNGTKVQLLWGLASWFKKPDDRYLAHRILVKAEEVGLAESDVMGLHFLYSQMAQAYYKDRTQPGMLKSAIEACEKQITIAPQAAAEFREGLRWIEEGSEGRLSNLSLPSHVGFKQLAIVLEKQKEYARAIELCKQAEKQGWSGDWQKRIERCQKKLDKL